MKIKGIFSSIINVAKREFKRLLSRRIYMLSMIVIPLFAFGTLLSIMDKGLPKDLPLAVVDLDNSFASRALIRQLNEMDQTCVMMTMASFEEARMCMQRGDVYSIIVIPKDFLSMVMTSKQPVIECYTNNSFMMAGGLLYRDMRIISELAAGKVILENGLARGQGERELMASIQPIKVEASVIGNPWLNYSMYLNNNLLPGILQLIILQITVFSISIEMKQRTAEQWLRLSRGRILYAVTGKLMVHTIIFFFVGIVSLLLLFGYEGFTLMNGWIPMMVLMLFFIIATQSLGVLFVTIFPAPRLSLSLASLFGMLSFSMSAFSYPALAMYPVIRMLTYIFPLRYYNIIYIDQALSGYPFSVSAIYYGALLLFLLPALFSLRLLKREVKEVGYIE